MHFKKFKSIYFYFHTLNQNFVCVSSLFHRTDTVIVGLSSQAIETKYFPSGT